MNLPLTGVAMVLIMLFLKVKAPQGSFREKILKLDWMCVMSNLPSHFLLCSHKDNAVATS